MLRVSVVIPSYNHERFLAETLRSLDAQTRLPDEVVVVDDGSTDGSADILRTWAKPGRRLIEQENRGAHAALNRGIEESTGDLVFLLNSDDRFPPGRIERLAAELERNASVEFAASWIRLIDEKGRALGVKEGWRNMHPWPARHPERTFVATSDPRWNLLQGNYLATTSNFAFTRALWKRKGPFLPLRFAHDWDFALTACLESEPMVLPEPLLEYRVHDRNTIRADPREMELEVLWVLARHLGPWVAKETTGPPERAQEFLDRLSESLHTFGKDRLFSLLEALARDDSPRSRFLALLEREDPLRRWLLSSS